MKPGDGMEGISWPSYQELIGDILSFQYVHLKQAPDGRNSVFAATRDPFDNHRMSYNAFETNRLVNIPVDPQCRPNSHSACAFFAKCSVVPPARALRYVAQPLRSKHNIP